MFRLILNYLYHKTIQVVLWYIYIDFNKSKITDLWFADSNFIRQSYYNYKLLYNIKLFLEKISSIYRITNRLIAILNK